MRHLACPECLLTVQWCTGTDSEWEAGVQVLHTHRTAINLSDPVPPGVDKMQTIWMHNCCRAEAGPPGPQPHTCLMWCTSVPVERRERRFCVYKEAPGFRPGPRQCTSTHLTHHEPTVRLSRGGVECAALLRGVPGAGAALGAGHRQPRPHGA